MKFHITPQDHSKGDVNAKIEIVEYIDFQCPYCKKAFWILRELPEDLQKNIRLVVRHFPLTGLHPNALHCAIAAEVANAQGKFWEWHDIIFQNQHHLEDSDLLKYADEIGLNTEKFAKEFSEPRFFEKVKADLASGEHYGVRGTPTFFINGEIFEGNWMDKEFVEYLQSI